MKPSVYIETSVFGYLTGRPSTDLLVAMRQAVTGTWWDEHRHRFVIYVSALVREESLKGDKAASGRRMAAIANIPFLIITAEVRALAADIIAQACIPEKVAEDALHIAVAAFNGMDYLLTWNFKHINNAEMKKRIEQVIAEHGYRCPVFCSPEELVGVPQ